MKRKWEVDDSTTVEANFGGLGKLVVSVNGKEVLKQRSVRTKRELSFALADGRSAVLSVKPELFGQPLIMLNVNGRDMIESGKGPIKCSGCGAVAKSHDRFCGSCGKTMPTADVHVNNKRVKEATRAIVWMAVLFLISGVVMFVVTKSQSVDALAKLEGLDPQSMFPTPINGETYTVAALRDQIRWEYWGILIVNLILAAVMVALAIWGRRAPLAAILIAAATYAVVIVTNAIIDPVTIGQGLLVKIIIIVLLIKGIKAALALRTANA